MGVQTKQDIIDAIHQTAKANGGRPLGEARFKKETGINSYDWGKYWARFGDAQKEAGFVLINVRSHTLIISSSRKLSALHANWENFQLSEK